MKTVKNWFKFYVNFGVSIIISWVGRIKYFKNIVCFLNNANSEDITGIIIRDCQLQYWLFVVWHVIFPTLKNNNV